MPWARRIGLYGGGIVLVIWIGAWIVLSGAAGQAWRWGERQVLEASADMGLRIENILLEGRENANRDILLALMNVRKGDPLFSLNPEEARDLIRRVDWVADARIERRWPDTVFVAITERQPLALWQRDKRLHLIDDAGEIIMTGDMERFQDLKIVIGEDAPQHARSILSILETFPDLYDKTRAAQRMDNRRWDLVLAQGTTVKLPETDIGPALSRLHEAHEERRILDHNLQSIDVRKSGSLIIRARPGEAEQYKAAAGQSRPDDI